MSQWPPLIVLVSVSGLAPSVCGVMTEGSASERAPGDPETAIQAIVTIRVDDAEPLHIVCKGTEFGSADLRFSGRCLAENGDWIACWNYTADLDPNGSAGVVGDVAIANMSDDRRAFRFRIDFPMDPLIANGSAIGGMMSATLKMDADGGSLSVPFGSSGWSALIDDDTVRDIHPGPFAMQGTGTGTAMVNASFGMPTPDLPAPGVDDGFGIRHCFRLTSGDTAIYATSLFVAGEPNDFRARPTRVDPVRVDQPGPNIRLDFNRKKPNRSMAGNRRTVEMPSGLPSRAVRGRRVKPGSP